MTPIKAVYNGIQDGPQPFELWTILESMGCTCHGQFSSLSINTIHAHNAILAKAELDHAIEAGKATLYLSWDQGQGGAQSNYRVSNWVGSWKSPHCYVRRGYSYGFGRFETFWV